MTDRIDFGGKPWSAIPRSTLRDPRLSPRALGGLVTLLSHEEGWVKSFIGILQREKDCGREQAQAIMRELVAAGYATRVKKNGAGGRFVTSYTVTPESASSAEGSVGSPATGSPATVEPSTVLPSAVVEAPDEEPLDVEPSTSELAPAARPRDEVWDALVAIYGQPTASGKGAMNAAGKVLRDFGADPAEIIWMANVLRRTDLSWAVTTPNALAKHFGERHALVAELDKKPFDRAAAIANGDLGG